MTSSTTYLPTGTVRQQFDDGAGDDFTDTLVALTEVADRERFDPSLVWTARRLVDNDPQLTGGDRRGVLLATLALLVAVDEGSTRIPLSNPDYLDTIFDRWTRRLEELGEKFSDVDPDRADRFHAANNAIGALRKQRDFPGLLIPDTAPNLIGRIDDELPYRPLLVSADSTELTSEQLLRKERELAGRFADQATRVLDSFDDDSIEEAVGELADCPTRYRADDRWHDQQLNWEQAHGALLPVFQPLTLLTGGPGTGKTTIVVSILRIVTRLGIAPGDIALAAPTGKAAQRLKESIHQQLESLASRDASIPEADARLQRRLPEARTLHRLLGYSPKYNRFFRNAESPLDARLVVCDEASMIDVRMMHALVRALPEGSRLVLVGDADQLPAVSGGAVFRDLVARSGVGEPDWMRLVDELAETPPEQQLPESSEEPLARHTVRLRKSYRMADDEAGGAEILRFAEAIRDCPADAAENESQPELLEIVGKRRALHELTDFEGVARLTVETELDDFIETWFERHVDARKHTRVVPTADSDEAKKALQTIDGEFDEPSRSRLAELFDHYERARILGVTRVFATGARAVNQAMHELHFTASGYERKESLMHLEPVMVQKNDYDLGVFNGDQGVVVNVSEHGDSETTKEVVFPKGDKDFRMINIGQIRDQIERSYATTIHKAQGSEFDHVAVVLPDEDLPLLTKQLLYTGVTRASESVTIYDANSLLVDAAATSERRFSGLEEGLQRALNATE